MLINNFNFKFIKFYINIKLYKFLKIFFYKFKYNFNKNPLNYNLIKIKIFIKIFYNIEKNILILNKFIEFYKNRIKINENFIIRKNTKIFIKKKYKYKYIKILDLFTGSGNFLIRLINILKKYYILSIDKKKYIIKENINNFKKILKKNIFKKKNLIKKIKKNYYDLIILNPPYINYKNKNIITNNLKFESISSLTDFNNGLYIIKKIIKNLFYYFKKNIFFVIEINKNQIINLKNLIKINNWKIKNIFF